MPIASTRPRMYLHSVAANSANGRRNPGKDKGATAPRSRLRALFFCSQSRVMAAVCGQASAWLGSFVPSIPTPCTAATISRRKDGGSSIDKGATPMRYTLTLNPSKARAAAYKAMALSALHSNSSLSVRLKRYNSHMTKARCLEVGGAK